MRESVVPSILAIVLASALGCAASGTAPGAPSRPVAPTAVETGSARAASAATGPDAISEPSGERAAEAPEAAEAAEPSAERAAEAAEPSAERAAEAPEAAEPSGAPAVETREYDFADADLEDEFLEDEFDPETGDPYERTNRRIFGFNLRIEKYVLDPISDAYEFVVPAAGRRAIHRAILNLNSTSVLVNDLFQLRPRRAGVTGSRFVINTTVGLIGLFDVAVKMGLERHHSDFGQTLALAGVPSGPYLILPIFGPSTARNAIGNITDGLFQPYFYLLGPTETLVLSAGSGFAVRDASRESIAALRATSVDFYAAMRIAYMMHRDKVINDRD
ncbi:MAG: VacJ family lipoprotein [Deltaproteobacteria bacterium]|nr:MAG: VacJ family lipoprotein [Deltaproteobacteria bacterium]